MTHTHLVTGASGAVGAACVRALLGRGDNVIGIDREPATVELDSLETYEHRVVDIRDGESVAALGGSVPPLSSLMSVAGGAVPGDGGHGGFELGEPEAFAQAVDLNLQAPYRIVHALQRDLEPGAGVLLLSSINASGSWGRAGYSAAKAGLDALARVLAEALGARGIRVNTLLSGSVALQDGRVRGDQDGRLTDELVSRTPIGRLARPEDVADAALALAVDLKHVTGAALRVDGGQDIRRRIR